MFFGFLSNLSIKLENYYIQIFFILSSFLMPTFLIYKIYNIWFQENRLNPEIISIYLQLEIKIFITIIAIFLIFLRFLLIFFINF
jgi:hypothetical protein